MKPKTALKQSEGSFLFEFQTSLLFLVLIVFSLFHGSSIVYYLIGLFIFTGIYAIMDYKNIVALKKEIPSYFLSKEYLRHRVRCHKSNIKYRLGWIAILVFLFIFFYDRFRDLFILLIVFDIACILFEYIRKRDYEQKLKNVDMK